jgi:seryl-tRNA synthetase
MLDLKFVRDNLDLLGEKTRERGLQIDFKPLKELEADRRQLLKKVEDLRQRRNTVSREIAARKQRREDAGDDIIAMREVSDRIKELEQKMREGDEALRQQLYELPNLQDATVPVGTDEDDNVEVRQWGSPPVFDFTPRPHWEVGEELGILDFERASKIAGARFSLSWGPGARMERFRNLRTISFASTGDGITSPRRRRCPSPTFTGTRSSRGRTFRRNIRPARPVSAEKRVPTAKIRGDSSGSISSTKWSS